MEPRKLARYTVGLQDQVMRDMIADEARTASSAGRDQVRGLLNPAQGLGPIVLDFIHPPAGIDRVPRWHRAALRLWSRGAHLADRALA
jgi:hypothetical protein